MEEIATRSRAWQVMAPELELVADLRGGTHKMRQAGLRWLPREAAESWTAWRARLNRTILFNGFGRTVQALSGKPFSEPVQFLDAHLELQNLSRNMDSCGTGLDEFARQMLTHLLLDGMVHIQIDRPAKGGQIYFVLRPALTVIGAHRHADGQLEEVRIAESLSRKKGQFGDEMVEAVRHITDRQWSLWVPKDTGRSGWHKMAAGRHDFNGVPLITLCVQPTGFMMGRPPLIDLAWLNLAHWQSSSDQRHILHVARVPILFGRALQLGQNEIEIGPNRLILADDPAADLKFVEHSGAAIEAGRQDLKDLEEKMAMLGLDMLSRNTGPVTATARQLDLAQNHAALYGVVSQLENGLRRMFEQAASCLGISVSEAGQIKISRGWLQQNGSAELARWLLDARQTGEISQEEFLQQAAHRGLLDFSLPSG